MTLQERFSVREGKVFNRHVAHLQDDALTTLMNGPVRQKLNIIPTSVTWGGTFCCYYYDFLLPHSATYVTYFWFTHCQFPCASSFLSSCRTGWKCFHQSVWRLHEARNRRRSVFRIICTYSWINRIDKNSSFSLVDFLLNSTKLEVTVYNAQLDLICDTLGVEGWVETLEWEGLKPFYEQPRNIITLHPKGNYTIGFVKNYETFSFYWMLRAGHMLPLDQGEAALRMMALIIHSKH